MLLILVHSSCVGNVSMTTSVDLSFRICIPLVFINIERGIAVGIQRKGLIWVGHKMPLDYVGHEVPLGRDSLSENLFGRGLQPLRSDTKCP